MIGTLLLAIAPVSAQASPETLERSLSNLLQSPLDVMLAPVVAGRTLYNNLRDINDTPGVRLFYTVPGYCWLTGLQFGAAVLRGVSGALELLPGLILLPLDTDLDALFDPADRGGAMVELENPLNESESFVRYIPLITWNVKFGIRYTGAEY